MKTSKKVLAWVLTLTVAFTMCFGSMSFAFATEETQEPQDEATPTTEQDVEKEPVGEEKDVEETATIKAQETVTTQENFSIADDDISPDATKIAGYGNTTKFIVPDAVNKYSTGKEAIEVSIEIANLKSDADNLANVKVYELPKFKTEGTEKDKQDFDYNNANEVTLSEDDVAYTEGILKVKPSIKKDGVYVVRLMSKLEKSDNTTLGIDNEIIFVAGPDLTVSYGSKSEDFYYDKNKDEMFYIRDGQRQNVTNTTVPNYSAIKYTGNNEPKTNAYGPDVLELIKITVNTGEEDVVSKFGEGQFVSVNSNDGYSSTHNWQNLFGHKRYYFPNENRPSGETAKGDKGIPIADYEWDDAVEVPAIIDLGENYEFSFGQLTPSERNKPGYNKYTGKAGVKITEKKSSKVFAAGIASIVIEDKASIKMEKPSIVLINDKDQVLDPYAEGKPVVTAESKKTIDDVKIDGTYDKLVEGDMIALAYGITEAVNKNKEGLGYCVIDTKATPIILGKKVNNKSKEVNVYGNSKPICYYTVDGSNPDMSSAITNYDPYSDNGINAPYVVEKAGSLVFKYVAYCYEGITDKTCIGKEVFEVSESVDLQKDVTVKLSAITCVAGSKPAVTLVKANGKALNKSLYSVKFNGYKKVGTATVIASGRDTAINSISTTYKVIPARASCSVKAGKKMLTVTIGNQKASGVTKYQIAYKLNKKKAKTKYITTSAQTYTIKKLSKKKKYTVQVRAYGSTGYGAWSPAKTVKTK